METFVHDKLIGGDFPIVTESNVLDTGNLKRGTVLGKIAVGTVPSTGTAGGSNVGNGTVTVVTGGVDTIGGVYSIKCTAIAADGGTFEVRNPWGQLIATAVLPGTAGGHIDASTPEINLRITDGSTDFALDDVFTVTVPAGSGKVVAVDRTAVDGSQTAYGVLAQDADASTADKVVTTYLSGQFNEQALIFGGTDGIVHHKAKMRERCMFTRQSIPE